VVGTSAQRLSRPRRRRVAVRRASAALRRFRSSELAVFLLLAAMGAAGCWVIWQYPDVPVSVIIVPLVIGSLVLSPRLLPWLVVYHFALLTAVVFVRPNWMDIGRVIGLAVDFVVGAVILWASLRRSRLGVAGVRGESMLVDLRDRISKQGRLPTLPPDWYAEAVLRSAGGSSFAGDFMVAGLSSHGAVLDVAVVDVSGKGVQAGTRSLQLSGAFGGLLGALPADRFLPAANEYLIEQDWSEGFATAVHLCLDLGTGAFELRSAGHPPAVQLHAGSGRWAVHEAEGPVLGLIPGAAFEVARGRLLGGDALLLYTDGLVETPYRELGLGIDRLTGLGEKLFRSGFEKGATRLVDRLESFNDDRALLLLHRR
jgi:hypothetical protein